MAKSEENRSQELRNDDASRASATQRATSWNTGEIREAQPVAWRGRSNRKRRSNEQTRAREQKEGRSKENGFTRQSLSGRPRENHNAKPPFALRLSSSFCRTARSPVRPPAPPARPFVRLSACPSDRLFVCLLSLSSPASRRFSRIRNSSPLLSCPALSSAVAPFVPSRLRPPFLLASSSLSLLLRFPVTAPSPPSPRLIIARRFISGTLRETGSLDRPVNRFFPIRRDSSSIVGFLRIALPTQLAKLSREDNERSSRKGKFVI